jgi:uncharacterized spore protein YtfJ
MDVPKIMERVQDMTSVRRVYGDPVERDGVVVIPAAVVRGGGGGGGGGGGTADGGGGAGGSGEGSGAGWGVHARPVGAWIVKDGQAYWEPALDLDRIIVGAQVATVVALLTLRTWLRRRRR